VVAPDGVRLIVVDPDPQQEPATPREDDSWPIVVLGPTGSLFPGWRRTVQVGKTSVLVHCEDDGIYAIENSCPHYQVPLNTGRRRGAYQECPWHHWLIDIRTGLCLHNPRIGARRYQVMVLDGQHVVLGTSADTTEGNPDTARTQH
jgi:nitrite reductase/ring-hydroxylating ferredoxin subunit